MDFRHLEALVLAVAVASATSCPALNASGPIIVSRNNQVIQNLDVTTIDSTTGIYCNGYTDVLIKNVRVTHYPQGSDAPVRRESSSQTGGAAPPPPGDSSADASVGIWFSNCDRIQLENVRVQLVDFPTGPLTSYKNYNIYGTDSDSPILTNIIVSGGSSGMWIGSCPRAKVSNWAGYNMHGPFPRGQCVQFSRVANGVISDFICKQQYWYSYPEDMISIWRSPNSTVQDGVLLGNSASTGVGLMFEQSSQGTEDSGVDLANSWGLAKNLRGTGIGGCCFSTYGGTQIQFQDVGCKNNHCEGVVGREAGSALMFFVGFENPSEYSNCCYSSNISLSDSKWYNTCRSGGGDQTYAPSNVLWRSSHNPDAWYPNPNQEAGGLMQEDFTINEHPIDLELCFTIDGKEYTASTQTGHNVGLYGDGSIDYKSGSTTELTAVLDIPHAHAANSGGAANVLPFVAVVALLLGVIVAFVKYRSAEVKYDVICSESQQSYASVQTSA